MAEEIVGRGRKHTIYRDPTWVPGRHRAVFSLHDQHYHDGSQWQDVVEALEDSALVGYAHKCDRMAHALHVGSTGTRRWYPRRNIQTEYIEFGRLQSWTGTQWQNVNLGTPVRSGNSLSWNTANFSLTLIVTWRRVKIAVVLKTETAKRRLRWAVSLVGLTWDNWSLRGADNNVVGWIDAPVAWDANGSADNPNVTITTSYAAGFVEFGGDLSQAVLPITIDPTFTDGYGGDVTTAKDAYLNSGNATFNYGTRDSFQASPALMGFDVQSIPADATCNSTTLYVYAYNAGTSLAFTQYVYSVAAANKDWIEGTKTGAQALAGESCWNALAADGAGGITTKWAGDAAGDGGADAGCSVSGTDFEAGVLGSYSGNRSDAAGTEYAVSLDTTRTAGWFGATNTNYGLRMTITVKLIASSDHATTGYRPKLVVVYILAAAGNPWHAYAQQ